MSLTLRKRSHEWIDARSLAMAEAIAEKIRRDPSLVDRARENLSRRKERLAQWPKALEEWEEILASFSLEEILSALLSDGEDGRRRRQSSPFTGILSPEERKVIFERYEEIGA